jgi:hypothetical protein
VILSAAPIVFPTHWQRVASDQRDYKKRIYGAIAGATLLVEPRTLRPAPGVGLSVSF